jgi:flavin reductase (DIM6/NTAB) family NADH-FMN oxidoreductase RutF
VTIHDTHPFLEPESERDPARRFRGRLGGSVTLWTSGSEEGRAGLTVSSLMVAGGEPWRILALLDPDSELAETLRETGRAVVHLLGWKHRDLADAFAGVAPAPGGAFRLAEFEAGDWGPRLVDSPGWAAVSLESERAAGWSSLVTCVIDDVHLGADTAPLVHRRGHYLRPTD